MRVLPTASAAILLLAAHLSAQDPAGKPADATAAAVPPAAAIVIADEPKTVDPATLVPKPLAAEVTVKFQEASLKDVIKWLQEEQKVGVMLDTKALSDARILLSEPVTDSLQVQPLYLLLDRFSSIGLAWYMQKGMLHLTTTAAAREHRVTLPYNLGDLLDAGFDPSDLTQAIQSGSAGPWKSSDHDGGGVVVLGDVAFVRQTEAQHREVAGLLAALRKHGRRTFSLDAPQHALLRAKLEQNVTFSFQETPLEAAIAELARLTQSDLRIDHSGLRGAGVRERTPVTLELADQSLDTALQAILSDLNLTWILKDGVLWITSRKDAEGFLKTAVYDVRDLCRDSSESSALRVALVGQTRGPWLPSGGVITFARPGVMVVRQTERGLDEVLQLLENYRLALRASKPRQRGGVDPKEIVTRYYRLPSEIAKAMSPLLPQMVQPETWTSPEHPQAQGAILHALPSESTLISADGFDVIPEAAAPAAGGDLNRALLVKNTVLVIRQSREVHEDIGKLFDRIRQGDAVRSMSGEGMPAAPSPPGGFGGGFFSIGK